tara:strand:+ start:6250 stop:7107 length:858 start_codon:yes stop_codon:yes gene_type:complete
MITTLQRTDKFLLEHAYAQARLYYTQLYTEADKTPEQMNDELIKSNKDLTDAQNANTAALEKQLNSKSRIGVGWAFLQAGKLVTAWAICNFDKLGNELYNPGKLNFKGGQTESPTIDLEAINRYNAVAVSILIVISLYHLKKGNYLAAFLFLLATLPGVAGELQKEVMQVGAVTMLIVSLINALSNFDLTLKPNQIIFKKFILKYKNRIKAAIQSNKLLSDSVKKIFIWLIDKFTPIPVGTFDGTSFKMKMPAAAAPKPTAAPKPPLPTTLTQQQTFTNQNNPYP